MNHLPLPGIRNLLFHFLLAGIVLTSCQPKEDPAPVGTFYESVTIDGRQWMVKNLDVVSYRNGDPIDHITDSTAWISAAAGAYCNYNNDTALVKTYGRLYNWHAVSDSRKLAPEGWHIATNAEWQSLINHLGGVDEAGGKLKEAGLEHWLAPNTEASNSSGFTALPGGFRSEDDGSFSSMGAYGAWWLASASTPTHSYSASLITITGKAYTGENTKTFGAYVRCVKD